MVEEECQQQLLLESSYIGAIVCPWEKNSLMLTEEGSGMEVGEEHQKIILQPIPINLNPNATAQPKNSQLTVHILPSTAAQFTPEAPAPKVEAIPSVLPMQYFKKLVATVQIFLTTSKTLAAYTA